LINPCCLNHGLRGLKDYTLSESWIKGIKRAFDMQITGYYSRVKNNAVGFMDYVRKEFHLEHV